MTRGIPTEHDSLEIRLFSAYLILQKRYGIKFEYKTRVVEAGIRLDLTTDWKTRHSVLLPIEPDKELQAMAFLLLQALPDQRKPRGCYTEHSCPGYEACTLCNDVFDVFDEGCKKDGLRACEGCGQEIRRHEMLLAIEIENWAYHDKRCAGFAGIIFEEPTLQEVVQSATLSAAEPPEV